VTAVYPHQSERLTEVLEREGLRALVASTPANVLYLTGSASLPHGPSRTPPLAVFAASGTALVTAATDVPAAVVDGVDAGHLIAHGRLAAHLPQRGGTAEQQRIRAIAEAAAPTPADALAAALTALGVTSGAIGLDEGGLTAPMWRAAVERLSDVTVVPAAAHFLAARRAKGPYELECLQRSLAIAEESLNAVLQVLKPGTTEREAIGVYETEVLHRGGQPLPGIVAAGPRTWIPRPVPTDRAMRSREVVRFDVGCVFKGYVSGVARTAVVGEPDERQQQVHDAIQAGVEAGIEAVKPGVPAAQIHAAVTAAARAAGLPDLALDDVGHGIGLEAWEAPALAAGPGATLEMGELLRLHVPWYEVGWAGLALGETVLVTRLGAHVVNRSVRGLIVLD
jgi:Xaa-Pro aminopeptidase